MASEFLSTILDSADLNTAIFMYCVVVVLAGAYLKGYTGFGASMFWMIGLSLALPPLQVVPMVLIFEVLTSIVLMPQIWQAVRWRSIGLLLLGTWAGMPVGIHALSTMPPTPIRIGLAVVVFVAAILILRGFTLAREPGPLATGGVGLMAGLLNGSMGIVGPPVILFYFSSPIGVIAGRASIIAYFIGTDSVGTMMFVAQGLIDKSVYWRTLIFVPLLIAGVLAGNRGFIKTDPETFKKVATCVLMALAIILFARAVLLQ